MLCLLTFMIEMFLMVFISVTSLATTRVFLARIGGIHCMIYLISLLKTADNRKYLPVLEISSFKQN